MDPVSVVLADSNALIKVGLRTILEKSEHIDIVGDASTAEELKEMAQRIHPDVVLIDYTSPEFSIDIIPDVLRIQPALRFVAITFQQTGITITNALKSGVMSYIKKDCDIDEIRDAVIETAKGKKFFCTAILDTIKSESININDPNNQPVSCEPVSLSERELEIITLISDGYTNNQIAEKLFLSGHTINTHRKNIMNKLGVNNTAGIVMYAVKSNLVSPNKYLFSSPS